MATRQLTAKRKPDLAQLDFSLGIFRDISRHRIPDGGAWDIRNALLDDDGMPFRRGGTTNHSGSALGSSGLTWIWDSYLDVGQRTVFANTDDFAVLDSDDETVINLGSDGLDAPVRDAVIAGMLFIGGGYIYAGSRETSSYSTTGTNTNVTNGSKTVTDADGGFTANVDAGMLLQVNSDERVYVVASVDSDTEVTIREELDGDGNVIGYEGSTSTTEDVTFYPIYKITASDPYKDADAYAVCANRLLVVSDELIEFSEIGKPHDWTATIGGETIPNQHEIPEGGVTLGVEALDQTALIFTNRAIWALEGLPFDIVDPDGNPQHRLRMLSRDLIVFCPCSIVTWQGALIVPCLDAIYLLDGVSAPVRISHPIDTLYRSYVNAGYRTGRSAVYRSHLFLPILDSSGDVVQDMLVCNLAAVRQRGGRDVYPWTRFDGAGGRVRALTVRRLSSAAQPLLLGAEEGSGSRVVECSSYFDPEASVASDADGTAHQFELVTRDYETGNMTENMVRKVRPDYQLVDAASDDPEISLAYATGLGDPDMAVWGHEDGSWGTGFGPSGTEPWTDAEEASFTTVCTLAEDPTGISPPLCRVNVKTRFIRYRLLCSDPAADLRVRSIEMFVRPSHSRRK